MKKLTIALAIFIFSLSLFAGYYIETQETTNGKPKIKKMWFDENGFRVDSSNIVMIFRLKDMTFFQINRIKKSYTQMTYEQIKKFTESMSQMMKQMMGSTEPKVTKTGEKKTILGFPCYRVKIETGAFIKQDGWFTDSIEIPLKIKEILVELSSSMTTDKTKEELVKVGFPMEVTTISNIMGQQTTTVSKVVKVKKVNIPDSIFNYNLSGYKQINPFQMGGTH